MTVIKFIALKRSSSILFAGMLSKIHDAFSVADNNPGITTQVRQCLYDEVWNYNLVTVKVLNSTDFCFVT